MSGCDAGNGGMPYHSDMLNLPRGQFYPQPESKRAFYKAKRVKRAQSSEIAKALLNDTNPKPILSILNF